MTSQTNQSVSNPRFIYGTAWKKEATSQLVQLAVSAGFTAIDTANQLIHYQEALVGDALLELAEQGIHRDTLFVQTKFTPVDGQDHRTPYDPLADIPTQVRQSFASSLDHLHTTYLDSYLLHGPYSRVGLEKADWEVWKTLEEIHQSGQAKMIGISNVNAHQLQQLCEGAKIKPMVVQNRCFAVTAWDKEVRDLCRTHGIDYQAFSLLTANREIVAHPYIREIANRRVATPQQIIFRFAIQIGMIPLTGTTSPQHMKEDLQVLEQDDLSAAEMSRIEMLGV